MPDLFASQAETEVRKALLAAKQSARRRFESVFDTAVDYAENRQLEDTRSQLGSRYKQTQSGTAGQTIEPVVVPLTERYLAEAATAYNKPVKRTLVDDSGEVAEEETGALNRALSEAGYDERLHRLDWFSLLLGSSCLWYQARRGALRPVLALPQNVYPIAPVDGSFFDPTNVDDYAGFIVEVDSGEEDYSSLRSRSYMFIGKDETIHYIGSDPFDMRKIVGRFDNPYLWEQIEDTEDQRGKAVVSPLQMLTVWHKRLPIGELLPDTDPEIVFLNREINVQLSVLMDTMRVQGWSMLAINRVNPEAPPPFESWGSRFVLNLDTAESASFLSAPNNYQGTVNTLENIVQLLAVSKRMSPNEFAIDGQSPQSGFAKLVDSLPKLEAREERLRRLKHQEEMVAWPRLASVLIYLGILPEKAKDLRLRVEFADIEFPLNVSEETQKQEHNFKHGLDTPASVLAKKLDITEEEAQEKIDERLGKAKAEEERERARQEEQQQQTQRPRLIGSLIGRSGPSPLPSSIAKEE